MQRTSPLSLLLAMFFLGPLTALRAVDFYSTGPGQGSPDTLDDVWQSLFNAWGLVPSADDDHDGCSNYVESLAGTDPRNPTDCLAVGNMAISANSVVITFRAEKGKQYQVWESDSPVGIPPAVGWSVVPGTLKISTADHVNDTIVFSKPANARKFYRLETRDTDTDGDGVSDWAENKTGTNPSVFSSSGDGISDGERLHSMLTLTATVAVANGFERNDKTLTTPAAVPAKINLTRSYGSMALTIPFTGSGGAPNATKANASGSDYTVPGSVAGAITIPANQGVPGTPFNVDVLPVQNAVDQVPRYLKMTFNLPGAAPGTPQPNATVCICDADPANPNNNQLFVAYLGKEAGASTTATGIATALVSGDNTSAAVNLTFSNLTSGQRSSETYIRYGTGIGTEVIPTAMPNGQVTGFSWTILAKASIGTDQGMFDALNSGSIFVSIPTDNYNPGTGVNSEIKGYFNRANGSTTFDSNNPNLVAQALPGSLTPGDVKRDIYRFLMQSTFGGTTELYNEINNLVIAQGGAGGSASSGTTTSTQLLTAYSQWLDKQIDPAQSPTISLTTLVQAADNEDFAMRGNRPLTYSNDPQYNGGLAYSVSYDSNGMPTISTTANTTQNSNNYPSSAANRKREWWTLVLQCKDQVRQRMALALSEILVTSDIDQTINDRHYGHAAYWDMIANGAFGKYRNLLQQVSYSPIMGVYLSHITNRAEYDAGGGLIVKPDENYAREIMQLFSIGLVLRHPDGSLVLDSDGLPIATYDQTDITELARVMTGWSHGARHANATVQTWSGTAFAISQQRVSPVLESNGTTSTWFGRDDGLRFFQAPWIQPMKLIGRIGTTIYHDFGAKTLLHLYNGGTVIPAQTVTNSAPITPASDSTTHTMADTDMTLAHNVLAGDPTSNTSYNGHQNTPVNISRWLIQRLVTSNPSAGYIYRVSQKYRDTNGNLGEVCKAILLDYEARSLTLADTSISFGKLKEPMVHFCNVLRSLHAFSGSSVKILRDNPPPFGTMDAMLSGGYPATEVSKFNTDNANPPSIPATWATGPFRFRINDTTGNIGQAPQHAPSVFNYFLPDYTEPGRMASAGLFCPELQIVTEASEFNRINYHFGYTVSNLVGMSTQPGSDSNVSDYTLSNSFATPALRFSADGGSTFVNSVDFKSTDFTQPDGSALKTITISSFNTGLLTGQQVGNVQFTLGGTLSGNDAVYGTSAVSVAPLAVTMNDNELTNEQLVITQSNGNTWVQEGGKTDDFTVMLSAPPQVGANVTVNLGIGTQATLSTNSLIFDSTNWNTPQTVTVTAVNDTNSESPGAGDDTVTFSTTSTLVNWNGVTATAIPVHVVDNDDGVSSYDVLITETGSPATNIVTETSTITPTASLPFDTYTIVLTKQPSASVTINITCDAQTQVNTTGTTWASTTTRTFTNANWNTPQTITIRGNQDTTQEGTAASTSLSTVTHSITTAAGGYLAGQVIQPLIFNVNDDDNRIILSHTGEDTRVQEGGISDTISVVLRQFVNGSASPATPSANVMVSLTSTQVLCNPSVLTFTSANAFTPQTVTITAADDWTPEGLHSAQIYAYAYSTDSNYNGHGSSNSSLGATLNATVIDSDNSQVIITESGGSTVVTEGYGADTYTVALSTPPTADVTLAMAVSTQLVISPTTLTFTSANWNTPQTVSVSASNDTTAEADGAVFIVTSVTSTDQKYNGRGVRTLNPTVLDNEAPIAVTQTNGFTTVAEGGATGAGNTAGTPTAQDTFTVSLPKTPTANVTVTLNTDSSQLTVSPSSLTFTSANFSTAQTVTVTAVDDAVTEATPHFSAVSFNLSSTDTYYNGNAAPPVVVAIKDNDAPGVSIVESSGTTLSTESATGSTSDTYTVVLTKLPTATVTVRVSCDSQTEVNTSGTTYAATKDLTFTTSTWNTAQTVTVRAKDDTTAELRHLGNITNSIVAGSASEYLSVSAAPVVMMITDNDNTVAANKVQITESSSSTVVSEGGTTDTYTVVLSTAPTGNVTVNISPDSQLAVTPSSLTFTSSNYSVAQTVTVRAADNALIETTTLYGGLLGASPHFGTITHSATSSDAAYNGITITPVTASITDNDAPRVIVAESGGSSSVVEGGAADSYTLVLSQQPASDVTITPTPDAQTTVSPASVTFTSANWSTPQTITITAVDDTTVENNLHPSTITHTATSNDSLWKNISVKPVIATVQDNEGARIVAGGTPVVTEGGANGTFTLKVFPPLGGFSVADTLTVSLVSPLFIIPVPTYPKQVGYYNYDVTPSGVVNNNQRDRIVMDYTEVIDLYRVTFYDNIKAANGGTLPASPSSTLIQNAHWAATKAIIDLMDVWWCNGNLKSRFPILIEPNQTPPSPTPAFNPRQTVLEAIYAMAGGASLPSTTRYLYLPTFDSANPRATYDPKNPPTDTFSTEVRDRARYAAYLMSSLSPSIVAH